MNQSNKLVLNKCDYKSIEDFYQVVFQQIRTLLDTKQVFSMHENPKIKGMYVIQFGPSVIDENSTFPIWLDAEEIASITTYNQFKEYTSARNFIEEFEKQCGDELDKFDDEFGTSTSKKKKTKKKDDDGGNFDA